MKTDPSESGLKVIGTPSAVEPAPRRPLGPRDITFAGLWQTFRRGLWLVAVVVVISLLVAVALLKARQPVYEASMTVAPAARDLAAASQLATELEQFADFATLAQSAPSTDRVSTLDRYLVTLTSVRTAERLADDEAIIIGLFGGEQGQTTDGAPPPDGVMARMKQTILGFFGFPERPEPGPSRLAAVLQDRLSVSGRGIYRLSVTDSDPAFATRLLASIHAAADGILREEALAQVRAQIDEIEAGLEGPVEAERREALETLLDGHYRSEALLAAEQPYAAQVIDPPSSSGWPTSTDPLLVLGLAVVVGLMIGTFVVFLRDALRSGAR